MFLYTIEGQLLCVVERDIDTSTPLDEAARIPRELEKLSKVRLGNRACVRLSVARFIAYYLCAPHCNCLPIHYRCCSSTWL